MSDRAAVIRTDAGWEIRASALNRCPRAVVREALGEPEVFPVAVLRAMARGKELEDEVLARVEDAIGGAVTDRQREVEVRLADGLVIRGHLDGMIDDLVVEVKTVGTGRRPRSSDDALQSWGRQLAAYALGASASGVVLGVYERGTGETDVYVLSDDLPSADELEAYVREILHAIEKGDASLVRCTCRRCAKSLVDDDYAAALLEDLGRVREEREALEKIEEQLKDALLRARDWRPDEAIEADGWRAVYIAPGERRRFDSRRHAAEHPECHERYEVLEPTRPSIRLIKRSA